MSVFVFVVVVICALVSLGLAFIAWKRLSRVLRGPLTATIQGASRAKIVLWSMVGLFAWLLPFAIVVALTSRYDMYNGGWFVFLLVFGLIAAVFAAAMRKPLFGLFVKLASVGLVLIAVISAFWFAGTQGTLPWLENSDAVAVNSDNSDQADPCASELSVFNTAQANLSAAEGDLDLARQANDDQAARAANSEVNEFTNRLNDAKTKLVNWPANHNGLNCPGRLPIANPNVLDLGNDAKVSLDSSDSVGDGLTPEWWIVDDVDQQDYIHKDGVFQFAQGGQHTIRLRVTDQYGRKSAWVPKNDLAVSERNDVQGSSSDDPSASPSDDGTTASCAWRMKSANHRGNRLLGSGFAPIQDAKTDSQAIKAANRWVDTIKTDPASLTAAVAIFLDVYMTPGSMTNTAGCASSDAVGYVGMLKDKVSDAFVVSTTAPKRLVNTGVYQTKPVQASASQTQKSGLPGNRKSVRLDLDSGRGKQVWLLARSGNIATRLPSGLPVGKTDR